MTELQAQEIIAKLGNIELGIGIIAGAVTVMYFWGTVYNGGRIKTYLKCLVGKITSSI